MKRCVSHKCRSTAQIPNVQSQAHLHLPFMISSCTLKTPHDPDRPRVRDPYKAFKVSRVRPSWERVVNVTNNAREQTTTTEIPGLFH